MQEALKATAESEMEGTKMEDCVISIPSYYTEVQRKAMLDAAGIAPLVLRAREQLKV